MKSPHGFTPLQNEKVIGSWSAGIPFGKKSSLSKLGGWLILTDLRLVFQARNTNPRGGSTTEEVSLTYASIADVTVDTRRKPSLLITTNLGAHSFLVIANRTSGAMSHEMVRDNALLELRKHLMLK